MSYFLEVSNDSDCSVTALSHEGIAKLVGCCLNHRLEVYPPA
jgi:hypothetical protein